MPLIPFKVVAASSQLDMHPPCNILVNRPRDSNSRWSTAGNSPPQFITLKLSEPAVLRSVTFGKYHKAHVCNVKRFSLLGGMREQNLVKIYAGALENNGTPETIFIDYSRDGRSFPIRYLKIVPQQAWGSCYNYSVWYVELHGITEPNFVAEALFDFNSDAEEKLVKACLKHFRRQGYSMAFDALEKETGVSLEAPRLTRLHGLLVDDGDFDGVEGVMRNARDEGLFDRFVSLKPYTVRWTNLNPCSLHPVNCSAPTDARDGSPTEGATPLNDACRSTERSPPINSRPCQRGGHQLCIDSETNTMYLFGGWDGARDLGDFWSYYIPEDKWTLLFAHTEPFGGPSSRSCHKMVLHKSKKQIYTLGRYIDTKHRTNDIKSDMYLYDIEMEQWKKICENTAAEGGPKLIFDHQMCIDSERNIIYVFGGRTLSSNYDDGNVVHSGLYSYDIEQDIWQLLLDDVANPDPTKETIISRVSHSMLFHPVTKTLYVIGGQRNKEHIADLLAINVNGPNVTVQSLCSASSLKRSPPAGYTQRATLDPDLDEIYVLSGYKRDRERQMTTSLWVFSLLHLQWSCIYKNDDDKEYSLKVPSAEPYPRFAHQLVYNTVTKVHFLFGGNPGKSSKPSLRLDDLWSLTLHRVCGSAEWKKAKKLIRMLKFEELAYRGKKKEALNYLRTCLYRTIDHSNPDESKEFQLLTMMLFTESQPILSFHPPAQFITGDRASLNEKNDYEKFNFSINSQGKEQQELFAKVLGMENPEREKSEENNTEERQSTNKITRDEWDKLRIRHKRCELFQQLSEYFPSHMRQPTYSLTDCTYS